jgi:hypothetical protein
MESCGENLCCSAILSSFSTIFPNYISKEKNIAEVERRPM